MRGGWKGVGGRIVGDVFDGAFLEVEVVSLGQFGIFW